MTLRYQRNVLTLNQLFDSCVLHGTVLPFLQYLYLNGNKDITTSKSQKDTYAKSRICTD